MISNSLFNPKSLLLLLAEFRAARSNDELRDIMISELDRLGLDQFVYIRFAVDTVLPEVSIYNYDPKWVDTYLARQFDRIDPVIKEAWGKSSPFHWSADQHTQKGSPECEFFTEAGKFGLEQGVTIPLRTLTRQKSFFTYSGLSSSRVLSSLIDDDGALTYLATAAQAFHRAAVSLVSGGKVGLTDYEREVAELLSEGLSSSEIAALYGVSTYTVNEKIALIARRLGVPNRAAIPAAIARLGRAL